MSHLEPERRAVGGRWRWFVWGAAVALLAAPAVAMRFTPEVMWGPGDFAVFGGLLAVVCVAIELIVRFIPTRGGRLLAGLVLLGVFLLTWAELAVGVWS